MHYIGRIFLASIVLASLNPCAVGAPIARHSRSQARQAPKLSSSGTATATIGFGFDIIDLETDHQFPGQKNTFHVSYTYGTLLKGGGFDPAGHKVSGNTFPYFQAVRDGMIGFIRNYKDKNDFYELFGNDIAMHVMNSYPQISSLELTIDVPAFGEVKCSRKVTLHLERKKRIK